MNSVFLGFYTAFIKKLFELRDALGCSLDA